MPQTGPAQSRALKMFRQRLADNWTDANGEIWHRHDSSPTLPAFTDPPANPGAILRLTPNRQFEDSFTWSGTTGQGQGSVSFGYGVQPRPGMDEAILTAETDIRALASVAENDDAEDIWTDSTVEVNPGVVPQGTPEELQNALIWTEFVVPYQYAEGFL